MGEEIMKNGWLVRVIPRLIVLGCLTLVATGCSGNKGPKLVPVSGKVTLDGKPLPGGVVNFFPAKEPDSKYHSVATIDSSGTYKLTTNGKDGAPLGSYKVTVATEMPPGADVKPGEMPPKLPAIHHKYKILDQTPLTVEVVESPAAGAYDLKVTK